jgi:hypothetical protein
MDPLASFELKPRQCRGFLYIACMTTSTRKTQSTKTKPRAAKPAAATVDEFVKLRVLPEFQPVVEEIRVLIKEYVPEVMEYITYGVPAYRLRNIIAVISPTKKDITLAFSRGAEFEDRYGLLMGVGKVSKNVKLKSVESIDSTALKYYLAQAVKLDRQGR